MATQIVKVNPPTEITVLIREREIRKKQRRMYDAIATGCSLPALGIVIGLGSLAISFIPDDTGTCEQIGAIGEICGGIITGLGIFLCPFTSFCRYSILEGMQKFYQKPENKV